MRRTNARTRTLASYRCMPTLATAPRVRSIDPTSYLPLARFSCGGDSDYEREVDELVGKLHAGDVRCVVLRAAEDPNTDSLIGVCGVSRRPLGYAADAAYIAVIGISSRWRGYRLLDGGRLGQFLLGDALDQIKAIWGGPPMPTVWAVIAPENRASHDTFAYWGFACLGGRGGYDVRYRPSGIGLSAS